MLFFRRQPAQEHERLRCSVSLTTRFYYLQALSQTTSFMMASGVTSLGNLRKACVKSSHALTEGTVTDIWLLGPMFSRTMRSNPSIWERGPIASFIALTTALKFCGSF